MGVCGWGDKYFDIASTIAQKILKALKELRFFSILISGKSLYWSLESQIKQIMEQSAQFLYQHVLTNKKNIIIEENLPRFN